MSVTLSLTAHDPLVSRDGRPFGAGQGNRMRGLSWILPSVVAGSFRTALVKANPELDFSWRNLSQEDLLQVEVAGAFPVHRNQLYLPAPNDCAWNEMTSQVNRVMPIQLQPGEGVDFPDEHKGLLPVRLSFDQAKHEFKAKTPPAWWPLTKMVEWLTSKNINYLPNWFTQDFLNSPIQSMRDHVAIEADRGSSAEGLLFSSSNLNLTHLPRFGKKIDDKKIAFDDLFGDITLSVRVAIQKASLKQENFNFWHPLGGERRMVHWQETNSSFWECPVPVKESLNGATNIRMVLATPAIFKNGWFPDFSSEPFKKLSLVGVSNSRWKAVSGWSLQPHQETGRPGPKPIRRMVPAGSVYFFTCEKGAAKDLSNHWLQSVSDDAKEKRDGFGLALWGTW